MPNRILKESICYSDQIDKLTAFEETVFYRLMVNVDDYGRIDGRIPFLKSKLFATKEGITLKNVESAILQLASVGLVKLYEVDKKPFLLFPKWELHQTIRNHKSKYPEPEERNPEKTGNCNQLQSIAFNCNQLKADVPVIQSNPNPNPNPNPNAKKTKEEVPYAKIKDSFNSICGNCYAKVTGINGKRQESVSARFGEYGLDGFEKAFQEMANSDFLKGENKNNWKATFDWLIKPSNFQKVVEGNYQNKQPKSNVNSPPPSYNLDKMDELITQGSVWD